MPKKSGPELRDPVGAITRAITRMNKDFSCGSPSSSDFVRKAVAILGVWTTTNERIEEIGTALFEDKGVKYKTDQQVAAFIFAELTAGR